MNGTVRRIVTNKNYGFIEGEDKQEYFFHRADVTDDTYDNMEAYAHKKKVTVEFDPINTEKGLRANNVRQIYE